MFVYIFTIGCQMNVYDSGRFLNLVLPLGFKETNDIGKADLIIVNTCTVRKKAEEKAYSFLGRAFILKEKNPNLIVVIAGCLAQQEGATLFKRFPKLNIILGTDNCHLLPSYIQKILNKEIAQIENTKTLNFIPLASESQIQTKKPTSFITIMQGCNNFCSYCIVPFVRGREKSRSPEDILNEAKNYIQNGVKEITLLGQNVNSYESIPFYKLLEKVNELKNLNRIRFATSHPKDLSDELILSFKNLDKLCPHIHLPLQSGSNEILKKMNRKYTIEDYLAKIEKLRKTVPNISITTDLIVGFPFETKENFNETLKIVEEIQFDNIFSFVYSDRKNTKAESFSEKVSEKEKKERIIELLEVQKFIMDKKSKVYENTIQEVLCEDISKKGKEIQYFGRTLTNKVVNFNSLENPIGKILKVKILKAMPNSLLGSLDF